MSYINQYICCITFRIKTQDTRQHIWDVETQKDLVHSGGLLGIMRRIFEIDTLPENLADLVFVFNGIIFANVLLIHNLPLLKVLKSFFWVCHKNTRS